jgi:hypothetical protein
MLPDRVETVECFYEGNTLPSGEDSCARFCEPGRIAHSAFVSPVATHDTRSNRLAVEFQLRLEPLAA